MKIPWVYSDSPDQRSSGRAAQFSQIDRLACPHCVEAPLVRESIGKLICRQCSTSYPVQDGIPILLRDTSRRSKLENIDYDSVHRIDEPACTRLYERWRRILDRYNVKGGEVLEVGCGTGFLTFGLLQANEFRNVTATDISLKFLRVLKTRTAKLAQVPELYVSDANFLPFLSQSYDAIVGNSVLHHFLEFERTLASCARILRPGGIAVFFEPVLQGKAIIAFLTDLLLRIDQSFDLETFDKEERVRLERLVNHQVVVPTLRHNRKRLASMEDKYIFDTSELQRIAQDAGFRSFSSFNQDAPAMRGYKPYLSRALSLHGVSPAQIKKFDFIFDSFARTLSDTLGTGISTPMKYLVFER